MKLSRGQILTIGPMVLVAVSYAVAAPARAIPDPMTVTEHGDAMDNSLFDTPISLQCERTANELQSQLLENWSVIVRVPFVLAGDLTAEELEQTYQQTIIPTSRALATSYFRDPPSRPTMILICSSDQQFRECNLRLDAQERKQYSGLYSRKHRRVIVNIASGEGTLAHELTHALAHADFPAMPEWFDEGLASLHEECEFSVDGAQLIGNENWRNQVAIEALHRGELRLIEEITSKRFGSVDRANIDYAHVRSLCQYLQEQGLLEAFYRNCRSNVKTDPTGLRSLCMTAQAATPRIFDDAFRAWLIVQFERPRS